MEKKNKILYSKFWIVALIVLLSCSKSEVGPSGLTSLVKITEEAAGTNCTDGGFKIETGVDKNSNSTLDTDEIQNMAYVCNGDNGASGTSGSNGTNGTNGNTSLIKVTIENAGTNCSSGGYRVDTGIDDNVNGTLDASEIDNTIYVCNGSSGFTHYIGELYGGGIIVSVYKQNGVEHGLIASLKDLGSVAWTTANYQSSSVTTNSAQSPIDGLANSNAIVAQAGAGTTYAAGLCRAYSADGDGGLNDWYLPALTELNQCYNVMLIVNSTLSATDGFQYTNYWSSSELNNTYGWSSYFFYGGSKYATKGTIYNVRAVRKF